VAVGNQVGRLDATGADCQLWRKRIFMQSLQPAAPDLARLSSCQFDTGN